MGESKKLLNYKNFDKQNKIIIGKNSTISNDANLFGPIIIGNDCKINSNVKLGPYVTIGNNTDIENSVIKNSIIMKNCKISSNTTLQNSIIGENCKILKVNQSNLILAENSII